MKKEVFACLVFLVLSTAAFSEMGKIYLIDLHYKSGVVSLVGVSEKQGYPPGLQIQPDKGYSYDVVSVTGQKLYSYRFDVPVKEYYDTFNSTTGRIIGGGVKNLDDVFFTLAVPYFPNAKAASVYDPSGVKILEADLSKFSEQKAQAAKSDNLVYLLAASLALIVIGVIYLKKRK